jgi:hypothetical protein
MSDYFVDFERIDIVGDDRIIDQGIVSIRADSVMAVHSSAIPETSRLLLISNQYADVRGTEDDVLARLRVRRSYLEGYVE